MSDNLNRLCKIDITLDNPVQTTAGFDHLLLIGPAPSNKGTSPSDVGVYSNIAEVTEAGWKAEGEGADPIGRAARIAFSQSPKPDHIYIAIRKEVKKGPEPEGSEMVPEGIADTLNRAVEMPGWYVICPCGIAESEFKTIAEWTEPREKIFAFTTMETTNPVGLLNYRSFGIYGKEQVNAAAPDDNNYAHVALVAKCLNYDAGSETWANQVLNGIKPANINSTTIQTLKEQRLSFVTSVGGKIISQGGQVSAGEWIDLIRFRDWLQNDMAARICNLLIQNPKIPYTDRGITAVENQMIASLKAGQARGGIAETEFDDLDKPIPGFETIMPLASKLTAADRASRVLKDCRFRARIAGAIHMVEIDGSLTYTF